MKKILPLCIACAFLLLTSCGNIINTADSGGSNYIGDDEEMIDFLNGIFGGVFAGAGLIPFE